MQKKFEAPALTVIGHSDTVVMGASGGSDDSGITQFAPDFEFEHDSL